jgi:ribose transport system permease protein
MEHLKNNAGLRWFKHQLADYLGMAAALAALIIIFSLITENFFSLLTFQTIANQIPSAIIVAVGMTFVLIMAEIDLSVGSVLAFSGAVLGIALVKWNLPLPLAILLCLVAGGLSGLFNGFVVTRWGVPSFIVTLGMLEVARGAAYLVTSSQTIYIGASIERISEIGLFGLTLPFLLAFIIVIAGQFFLTYSVPGRHLLAIGSNENAARLVGINIRSVKIIVFSLTGLLAALASIIQCSRLSAADPNAGAGFELQAIAAVVIGGTSLTGGRGSVIRTFIGVLIIAVLGAGLAQTGAQEPAKRLITGLVIVAAVILDKYRQRMSNKNS